MLSAYLWLSGAVVCGLLAFGVLIVVVFPAAVWRVREVAVAALVNFATLYPDRVNDQQFRLLELRALLYDNAESRSRVASRLSKLRELYLALDQRGRNATFSDDEIEKYGRRCLLELVQIVKEGVQSLRPSGKVDAPIVYAKDLLKFIANRQQSFLLEPHVEKTSHVETYFRRSPMTVEQMAALLEAICYGLLYRSEGPLNVPQDQLELLTDIIRREQRLRVFVEERVFNPAGGQSDVFSTISSLLGEEIAVAIRERAGGTESSTDEDSGRHDRLLLEYLYLDQLKQLIQKEWSRVRDVLPEKRRINEVFDVVVPVRNNLAHGRRVSSEQAALARAGLHEMDAWLEKALSTRSA